MLLATRTERRRATARFHCSCSRGQPHLVLADEPTSNLDAETTRIFLSVLQELQAENKTVVIASHDPRLIEIASKSYSLRDGRLLLPD